MKIIYIDGDLFKTDVEYIVHGCNAQGVMGSGVAKIIRDDYTKAYDEYRARHQKKKWRLGEIQIVDCGRDKKIINAITQEFYGRDEKRYVNYEAIAVAFEQINEYFYTISYGKCAMPMIGAGLGNGDWSIISAIIESESTAFQPFVYRPTKSIEKEGFI